MIFLQCLYMMIMKFNVLLYLATITMTAIVAVIILVHVQSVFQKNTVVNHNNNNQQLRAINPNSLNKNYPYAILHFTPLSKDLVVNSAYFDNRPRSGHSNVTIFFIVANKTIFLSKWIIGCGVGATETTDFIVRYVYEDILMHQVFGHDAYPYEQLAVECYDLKVANGSRAFLTYKTSDTAKGIVVESERPLMIPAPRIQPTGEYNFTVAVCTKVHNRGVPWLPEFIRYQKTIGVDHVHLSIMERFIKDGGLSEHMMNDPFMQEAVYSGYMTISVWKKWHENEESYDHSTILQYLDCYYRFRGTYDYISPMDTDDFFTPRIPGKTQLKHYINKYCHSKRAGSCSFKWLWLYPDICGMTGKVGEDGNVTRHVASHKLTDKYHNLKSVHSTAAIIDSSYHDAKCEGCLMPGSEVVEVPQHVAYVTHNRVFVKERSDQVC